MARKKLEGDAALFAKWKRIRDPKRALEELCANETFLGYDPYYKDFREALLDMCERCSR